jgi:preprotein translocase subunit SecG
MKIVITVIQLIACAAIVSIVLLQSGKSSGLSSAITGGGNSNSFLARNKAKSMDAQLAKATKWLAIVFVLLTLILNFM